METQCPLCHRRQHQDPDSQAELRWRLCADCGHRFAQAWRSIGPAGGLERCGEPTWAVDENARLLACNRLAEGLFGAPQALLLGLAPGELLDCDNARSAGCGQSPDCQCCGLRQAILYTQRQDRDCERLPVVLPVTREQRPQMRCLSISTRRMGASVRLQLEEDGLLPLH